MLTDLQRAAVIKEAKSWTGTPYRGWASLKGVGTDCGQLIYGVFRACGLLPVLELPKDYSLQVAQHQTSTEYMQLIDIYFRVIPESEVKPGDLVCYKLGLSMAHAAIIVDWPSFVIQAELHHGVSGSHGMNNPRLRQRHYLHGTVREFCTLRDEFSKGGF
jgi:cell wall-associated NlpC family hydrolase